MSKIGLISFGFPKFRYDIAQQYLEKTVELFEKNGIDDIEVINRVVINEEDAKQHFNYFKAQNISILIIQCGTYSFGSNLLKYSDILGNVPLILWGFPEPLVEGYTGLPLNSLCGLNMYASFLKKLNIKFDYLYKEVNEESIGLIINKVNALKIVSKLKSSKYCIIGGRVPGFYLSNVDELKFKREIGPEIIHYSIAQLLKDAELFVGEQLQNTISEIKNSVCKCNVDEEYIERNAKIYLAIKKFKEENDVDGFSIKCWPEFQDLYNVAVCSVVSKLNDDGIVTSCEGDVTSLCTMHIQSMLTNKPVFLADLVNINRDGSIKAWHCGKGPLKLAKPNTTKFIEHPTMGGGLGVATEYEMITGSVDVAKLKEDENGYSILHVSGEAKDPDRYIRGNQIDIKLNCDHEKFLETVIDNGIEHHYAVSYGDTKKSMKDICKWLNIRLIEVK